MTISTTILSLVSILILAYFLKQKHQKNLVINRSVWLGLAIILSSLVLWYSITDLNDLYTPGKVRTISMPTKLAPVPTENNLAQTYLLQHFIIDHTTERILKVKEDIVTSHRPEVITYIDYQTIKIESSITIGNYNPKQAKTSAQLKLKYNFENILGSGSYSIGSLGTGQLAKQNTIHISNSLLSQNPFSLVNDKVNKAYIAVFLTRLHPKDVLKQVPSTDILKHIRPYRQRFLKSDKAPKPRFLQLFNQFDNVSVCLLLIAFFISRASKRLNLPIALALVLGLSFGFKRIEFQYDKNAYIGSNQEHKLIAIDKLNKSLFYSKSAKGILTSAELTPVKNIYYNFNQGVFINSGPILTENQVIKGENDPEYQTIKLQLKNRDHSVETGYYPAFQNFYKDKYHHRENIGVVYNLPNNQHKIFYSSIYKVPLALKFFKENDVTVTSEIIKFERKYAPKVLVKESWYHRGVKRAHFYLELNYTYPLRGRRVGDMELEKVEYLQPSTNFTSLEEALEHHFYASSTNFLYLYKSYFRNRLPYRLPKTFHLKASENLKKDNLLYTLVFNDSSMAVRNQS